MCGSEQQQSVADLVFCRTAVCEYRQAGPDFNENLACEFKFQWNDRSAATLRFDFDVTQGVSARIFTLSLHGKPIPTLSAKN